MHVLLETARMRLHRFTMDDVDEVLELDRDPRVRRFVEDGLPVDRPTTEEMVASWIAGYERWERFGFWAANTRESDRFLGWFHLRPRNVASAASPELGYRLIAEVWDQGYGTEGSRALIDHAFADPAVERVVAETMVVHTASRRVMEKAGMIPVRTFVTDWPVRIPGDEEGDVEYAITRSAWDQARRRP